MMQRNSQNQLEPVETQLPDSHSDVILAAFTPNVVGHFKSNDKDAKMKFGGSLTQSVSAKESVKTSFLRVIVGRVVLVLSFSFTL